MRSKRKQSGLSLMEEVMVVASVALLLYIAMPSVKNWFNTLETPAGARTMISSALSSARAMAAQHQKYVGVRFQHAYYNDPENPNPDPLKSPLKMPQYMIFIIHDFDKTGLVDGFRVVEGTEPIKLPENIGVMDLYIDAGNYEEIDSDVDLDSDEKLNDATTFSIIFSPAGKVIVLNVQVRNRDGADYNDHNSEDDIFNTDRNVDDGYAMFIQDDYPTWEYQQEPSRRAFIIYDRSIFTGLPEKQRYSDYIEDLEPVYLNSYTGTMINK